jgi:signal transduction histidine kinase
VLSNLVLNEAQAGSRHIDIAARSEGERLIIDLADNGPGIPRAQRDSLFKPFAGAGRDGGSSLGLAIAREIVRAHGGELSLAATGPGGTTFRIDLPRRGTAADRPAAA